MFVLYPLHLVYFLSEHDFNEFESSYDIDMKYTIQKAFEKKNLSGCIYLDEVKKFQRLEHQIVSGIHIYIYIHICMSMYMHMLMHAYIHMYYDFDPLMYIRL